MSYYITIVIAIVFLSTTHSIQVLLEPGELTRTNNFPGNSVDPASTLNVEIKEREAVSVILDIPLPAGYVKTFLAQIGINNEVPSVHMGFQIWRPQTGNNNFTLFWTHNVLKNILHSTHENITPYLLSVQLEAGEEIQLQEGDHFGWTIFRNVPIQRYTPLKTIDTFHRYWIEGIGKIHLHSSYEFVNSNLKFSNMVAGVKIIPTLDTNGLSNMYYLIIMITISGIALILLILATAVICCAWCGRRSEVQPQVISKEQAYEIPIRTNSAQSTTDEHYYETIDPEDGYIDIQGSPRYSKK